MEAIVQTPPAIAGFANAAAPSDSQTVNAPTSGENKGFGSALADEQAKATAQTPNSDAKTTAATAKDVNSTSEPQQKANAAAQTDAPVISEADSILPLGVQVSADEPVAAASDLLAKDSVVPSKGLGAALKEEAPVIQANADTLDTQVTALEAPVEDTASDEGGLESVSVSAAPAIVLDPIDDEPALSSLIAAASPVASLAGSQAKPGSSQVTPATSEDESATVTGDDAALAIAQTELPITKIETPAAVTPPKPADTLDAAPTALPAKQLADGQPAPSDTGTAKIDASIEDPEQILSYRQDQPKPSPAAPANEQPTANMAAERVNVPAPGAPSAQPILTADASQQKPVPEITIQVPQQRAEVAAKQVGLEISRQALKSETQFAIRMDPPELGRLDVKLTVSKGADVQATILVEREATLELLNRDVKALERALNDAGLKTDQNSLQLSLKNQGFGQEGGEQNAGGARSGLAANSNEMDDAEAVPDEVIAAQAMQHPASLRPVDILI